MGSDAKVETQVAGFIAKFDPLMAKFLRACRAAVQKRLPTANELVYDNYNFFVIGYSSTERTSDCVVSLSANVTGINLNFYWGSKLPDPGKLLDGSGTQNRFLRLDRAATIRHPEVEALIAAALEQAKTPMPASGKPKTIIKLIAPKQRPRR